MNNCYEKTEVRVFGKQFYSYDTHVAEASSLNIFILSSVSSGSPLSPSVTSKTTLQEHSLKIPVRSVIALIVKK